jgi:hypothetical protein
MRSRADWINLVQNGEEWQALVKQKSSSGLYKVLEINQLLGFQERLPSVHLVKDH